MSSNRNKNPNKYAAVNRLGANTKIRHKDILAKLLDQCYQRGVIYPIDVSSGRISGTSLSSSNPWVWGNLGPRIGGRRSADGMIYDLPGAPMNRTTGNKVVLKMIFSDNDDPMNEIRIGALAGNARVGPRTYAAYYCDLQRIGKTARQISTNITTNGKKLRLQNGREFVNLFQGYWAYPFARSTITKMFMIVMENLYSNPSRGVNGGATLSDIVDPSTRNGYRGWRVPLQSIRSRLTKLHELGVVHADLHPGNVVIQRIRRQNGSVDYSARIIDFGRSILVGRRLLSNANANRQIPGSRSTNRAYPNHIWNAQGIARLPNSVAWRGIERLGRPLSAGTVESARLMFRNQQLEARAAAEAAARARQAVQRNRMSAAQRNRLAAAQRNRLAAAQRNRRLAAQRAQEAAAASQAVAMNWEPTGRVVEATPMNWQPLNLTALQRGRLTGSQVNRMLARSPTVPARRGGAQGTVPARRQVNEAVPMNIN